MASVIPPDIKEDKTKDIKLAALEDPRKYSVFDPRRVPCLRASLLTGIGGGITFAVILLEKRNLLIIKIGQSNMARVAFISYTCIASAFWPICRYNDTVKKERVKATMENKYQEHKLEKVILSEYEQVKKDEEDFLKNTKITSVEDMDKKKAS